MNFDPETAPQAASPTSYVAPSGRSLLVVNLRGDEPTMGHQHGTLLREHGDWQAVLDYYPKMPEILIGLRGGAPMPLVRPLIALWKRRMDRRRPKATRARSRAFFEALGLPAECARTHFVMDILQNVVGLAGRIGVGASQRVAQACAVPACSSVAVWGPASKGGTVRHARNFDFPGAGLWEKGPAVVLCRPDQGQAYGFVTTRGGDVAAVTAWNEAGLTVAPHTRFHQDVRFDGIGIVDLMHELVTRAETLADAERIARERPIASTWGVLVSSARERRAVLLETTGRAVEVVSPRPGESWLAQTNRYQAAPLKRREVAPSVGHIANSDGRHRALRARVAAGLDVGGLDEKDLMALLGSYAFEGTGPERPAGGVLAQGISVQSVVVEPEARRAHVSIGQAPTGSGPWVEVPFAWDGPVGARVVGPEAGAHGPRSRFHHGPVHAAHRRFIEAVAFDGQGAPEEKISESLEAAIAIDPAEPAYRFLAAGWRLKRGDVEGALAHLEQALTHEAPPFERGQLLLWASRCAGALGRTARAGELRGELLRLSHPLLADHHHAAKREADRPPTARGLRRTQVNMVFPDLTLR